MRIDQDIGHPPFATGQVGFCGREALIDNPERQPLRETRFFQSAFHSEIEHGIAEAGDADKDSS
ncbi:hypothetical protein [Agrobacterium vitis]|uniref:hypothetical protein n=1 Tax=Agrobacterium vitis TaxID=373 RepID=UPI0018D201ED|nr:hypothetical protein [Agrobacterium vitis]